MNLGSIAVPFVVFYSINNIYINRKSSWKDAVSIVAGFFYAFVIAKTRIVLAAYIIALIGGYMIWKRGGKRKIIVFIALILFVVFLSQTKLFSYLMDGLKMCIRDRFDRFSSYEWDKEMGDKLRLRKVRYS